MLIKSVIVSIPVDIQEENIFKTPFGLMFLLRKEQKCCLPTKHCFLLSQRGAALTPFDTRAKNAFLTCRNRFQYTIMKLHLNGNFSLESRFLPEGTYQTQLVWNWWVRGHNIDETS